MSNAKKALKRAQDLKAAVLLPDGRLAMTWDDVQMKFHASGDPMDFFPLGRIIRLQHVGPYGLVEYVKEHSGSYHRIFVAGRDTGIEKRSVEAAVVHAIAFITHGWTPDDAVRREATARAACRALDVADI